MAKRCSHLTKLQKACRNQHECTHALQTRRSKKKEQKTDGRKDIAKKSPRHGDFDAFFVSFLSRCRSDILRLLALVSVASESKPTSSSKKIHQSQTKLKPRRTVERFFRQELRILAICPLLRAGAEGCTLNCVNDTICLSCNMQTNFCVPTHARKNLQLSRRTLTCEHC